MPGLGFKGIMSDFQLISLGKSNKVPEARDALLGVQTHPQAPWQE
jgi:hypothetical protein